MESPSYEGHSLTMLRRVAKVLDATIRLTIAPKGESEPVALTGAKRAYKIRRKS